MPRRFQFGLRTLMIVVAILAVSLRWFAYKADKQRSAVDALQENGAKIFYNGTYSAASILMHWRAHVTDVRLENKATDSDIAALQSLEKLRGVYFRDVTDEPRLKAALPQCTVLWTTIFYR